MKKDSGYSPKLSESRNGFTIVELLIVVVIIAILATITIVSYNGIQARAYVAATTSNIKIYANALEMLKAEKGTYSKVNGCIGETSGVCSYYIYQGDKCQSDFNTAPGRYPVPSSSNSQLQLDLKPYISGTPKQSMSQPVVTSTLDMGGCTSSIEYSSPTYLSANELVIQSNGQVRAVYNPDLSNAGTAYYILYILKGNAECYISGSYKQLGNGFTQCYVLGGKITKE